MQDDVKQVPTKSTRIDMDFDLYLKVCAMRQEGGVTLRQIVHEGVRMWIDSHEAAKTA